MKNGRDLEAEVKRLHELNMSYFLELEGERSKTAQDIHDLVGQQLSVVNIKLKRLESDIDDPLIKEKFAELEAVVAYSIDSARRLINEISPRIIYEQRLGICLEWLSDYFTENHFLDLFLSYPEDLPSAGNELQVFLFRSLFALLMNVVVHSGKQEAKILVEKTDGKYHFRITDHGRGFDADQLFSLELQKEKRIGLLKIYQQSKYFGGALEFESREGGGTVVDLIIPEKAFA